MARDRLERDTALWVERDKRRNRHIVIVDDDEDTLALLNYMTKRQGHTVTLSRTAVSVVRGLDWTDVYGALIDWMLDDPSEQATAIDTIKFLRATAPHVRIVVVTNAFLPTVQSAVADAGIMVPVFPKMRFSDALSHLGVASVLDERDEDE